MGLQMLESKGNIYQLCPLLQNAIMTMMMKRRTMNDDDEDEKDVRVVKKDWFEDRRSSLMRPR